MVAQIDSTYARVRPGKLVSRLLSYALFEGRPLTTKGRWINLLVFFLYGIAQKVPKLRPVECPIFIVGTGRSGTTILGVLLSIHRDVGFLNEPKALWSYAFRGEDLIGSYSRAPARYYLGAGDSSPTVKDKMHRIYSFYLLVTGSSRIVDKYPELIFRVPFVRAIFPDAKFLFLIRNGWDACRSIEHWSKQFGETQGTETHDWWGVDNRKWRLLVEQVVPRDPGLAPYIEEIRKFKKHTDMAAVEWIVTMREGMRLRKTLPSEVHTVVYEELAEKADGVLDDLLEFCKLPPDADFYRYASITLRSGKRKAELELHPSIIGEFNKVMAELGYTTSYVQSNGMGGR
jgi:hypothetical protein